MIHFAFILLIVSCGSLLLVILNVVKRVKAVHRRFTWLGDDVFLAQCSPGTDREIALKVRRIVANRFGVPYNRVSPSSTFAELDLYLDLLDL